MKAIVNKRDFNIIEKTGQPGSFEVNGKNITIDIISPEKNVMHILFGSRSYRVHIIQYNEEQRIVTVGVNGCNYDVKLKNESDELLERLGLSAKVHKAAVVKAPMPGKVIDIMVKAGDRVNKNDSMIVLEAMKMENLIKAQSDGIVKQIHVTKGMAVEKNQELVTMEN